MPDLIRHPENKFQEGGMKNENGKWNSKTGISFIALLVFIALAITSINACGYLGIFGEASWKEEVLLHDGSKIIVKRWQKTINVYSYEKSTLLQRQSLNFKHPKTREKIVWKDGPTEGIRNANFRLLAFHIKDNTPYIITEAYDCFSYNKWGRPNPPYIIFKYEGEEWKRIAIHDLPSELTSINLMLNTTGKTEINTALRGLATTDNRIKLRRPPHAMYKSIVRTPMEGVGCMGMIYDGRVWTGFDYSKMKVSYEVCIDTCKNVLSNQKYCPCDNLYNKSNKGE
jgi:hypothetical protein